MTHRVGPAVLVKARWATRGLFLTLGIVAGTWGVHVPSVKSTYTLDAWTLAVALFATSIGSVMALFVAGRLIGRTGVAAAVRLAGCAMALALGLALVLPGYRALLPVMVLLGAGESVFDVAINAEGTALEALGGKPVMSGFHGMFSLGAMTGSALAAGLLSAGVAPAVQLTAVAVSTALCTLLASRLMLPDAPPTEDHKAHFALPTGPLLVIGALIFFAMLAEGVMYNWSVLYVQEELATPQRTAAWAYVAFAGATALVRFAGDALRARFDERAILVVGPLLTAIAMSVVLLVARPWAALAGFACIGAGLATVVPLLYNAATRVKGASRAAAIASVSSIGYLGFMVGPPLIGAVARATSLTLAMAIQIVAAMVVVLGARRVPGATRQG